MKRPSQARRRNRKRVKARRQDRKRVKATTAPRKRLSLANPPTDATMTIEELAELTEDGRNSTYEKVRAGLFPSIRLRRGKIAVLTVPALQILRGERPPGGTLVEGSDSSEEAPPRGEEEASGEAVQGRDRTGGGCAMTAQRTPPLSARELRQRTLPRRGLGRTEAANFIGVAPRTFSRLVTAGHMPKPRVITTASGSIERWDVTELDAAVDALPHRDEPALAPDLSQPPKRRPFSL